MQRLWWTLGDYTTVFFRQHRYIKNILSYGILVLIIAGVIAGVYFFGVPKMSIFSAPFAASVAVTTTLFSLAQRISVNRVLSIGICFAVAPSPRKRIVCVHSAPVTSALVG